MAASRPVWGAWIEISTPVLTTTATRPRPVWGAWIEMGIMSLPDTSA